MAKPFYHTRMQVDTVQSLIDKTVSQFAKYPFCSYTADGQNYSRSYGDLMDDIRNIEAFLSETGARHVGLLGATGYPWLSVLMACFHAGVVVVPLDALLSEEDLCYNIEHADIEILFCDKKFESLPDKIKGGKLDAFYFLDTDGEGSLSFEMNSRSTAHYAAHVSHTELKKDDLAMILYTSGTTGKPKGVMLSQENLAASAHYGASVVDTPVRSRLLVILPNNHIFTISHCFLTPLFFGANLCLNDSIYNTFANIKKYKIDFIVAVPAVMKLFKMEIDNQLRTAGFGPLETLDKIKRTLVSVAVRNKIGSNLHSIVCGGAPLDPSYVHAFRMLGIQLQGGYGMTECAPLISCQVKNHIDYDRAASVGRPGVCCEVKIAGGEILVRGKNVMLGYYKDPESTAETFSDGWLKTGDNGYLDEEGFLYITGRSKNLIILGNGENVSPEELELLFNKSGYIDGIVVSANETLDVISAEILPAKRAVAEMGLEKVQSEIRREVKEANQKLPIYKQIKLVNFRDTPFDMTTTLKIKR